MLQSGLGFDEVGVVHQPSHPLILGEQRDPMIDMHLDTYFNVASSRKNAFGGAPCGSHQSQPAGLPVVSVDGNTGNNHNSDGHGRLVHPLTARST